MDELVIENQHLIYFVLKKLKMYHLIDDYYDIGMIGLVKAGKYYTEEKGKFSTYACKVIANEIKSEIRKLNSTKRTGETVSINQVIYNGGDNEITLEDTISSNINIEDEIIHKDQCSKMYKAIEHLNEKEKKVIKAYYGIGEKELNQKEISKLTNLSQAQISRTLTKAIEKIRKEVMK